jgi:hypothetical protein
MPEIAVNKAAADKSAATKDGAVEGAASVADAVKRVADAAVAEVQKTKVAELPGDFHFTGTPGGRFRADGQGFGSSGVIRVAGQQVQTTGWGSTHIEGTLPADVKSGEVTVHVDENTVQRGHFSR